MVRVIFRTRGVGVTVTVSLGLGSRTGQIPRR